MREGAAAEDAEDALAAKRVRARRDHRVLRRLQTNGTFLARGGAVAVTLRRTQRLDHARAVGGACGANPIPVIVPCHRVVGANGSLTGFSGGMKWKVRLLRIEGIELPLH